MIGTAATAKRTSPHHSDACDLDNYTKEDTTRYSAQCLAEVMAGPRTLMIKLPFLQRSAGGRKGRCTARRCA